MAKQFTSVRIGGHRRTDGRDLSRLGQTFLFWHLGTAGLEGCDRLLCSRGHSLPSNPRIIFFLSRERERETWLSWTKSLIPFWRNRFSKQKMVLIRFQAVHKSLNSIGNNQILQLFCYTFQIEKEQGKIIVLLKSSHFSVWSLSPYFFQGTVMAQGFSSTFPPTLYIYSFLSWIEFCIVISFKLNKI